MKSIFDCLASFTPSIMLPIIIIVRRLKKLLCVVLIFELLSLSSCFLRFYKANSTNKIDASIIQQLQSAHKYFVLHAENGAFALLNTKVGNEILEGDIENLPKEHEKYLYSSEGKSYRFPAKEEAIVLYEVHLYTGNYADTNRHIILRFQEISRLDIYKLDKGATTGSTIISIVGLTIGGLAVVAGVLFLITCNCPQVSVCAGDKCEFTGGLYSGAIYAPLERTDYMALQDVHPIDNKLHFQVSNVEGEEQFINEIKLMEVEHDNANQVLVDRHGKILVYQHPIAPDHAFNNDKEDIKEKISAPDDKYYSFTNLSSDKNASDIMLDFRKPSRAITGKLVLRAKNSAWSGYLFREFKSLFGNYYENWTERKDKADPKEMEKWQIDQCLPLLVSIKHGDSWKYVDYFATPGNSAARDMIMEIDLAAFKNEEHFQLRLQTTFLFWDLDYAGMDFTENNPYTSTVLTADEILRSDNVSLKEQLSQKDKSYAHLSGKERLQVEFSTASPAFARERTSYFLVSSGYYHFKKQFESTPQIKELKAFLERGAFDKYSREKFAALQYVLNDTTISDISAKK